MNYKIFWSKVDLSLQTINFLNNSINKLPELIKLIIKHKQDYLITNCWNWNGSLDKDGYGKYSQTGAHRIVWILSRRKNPPANKNIIRHTCDNRSCVNPFHLRYGTEFDNAKDMVNRHRSLTGENHPFAVLTEEEAKNILYELYMGTSTINALAKKYNITETPIEYIAKGKIWKHLYKQLNEEHIDQIEYYLQKNKLRNKISEEDVRKIRNMWETGNYTKTDIAKHFGLKGVTTITNIITGYAWSHVV